MKSPIILGTDMTKLKESTLKVIRNKVASHHQSKSRDGTDMTQGILAINQDPPGWAATTFTPAGQPGPVSGKLYKFFAGPLSDGVVVGLVAADGAETLTVNFSDVPGLGPGTFSWTELYSGRTGTGMTASADLENHDMAVFKVVRTASQGQIVWDEPIREGPVWDDPI